MAGGSSAVADALLNFFQSFCLPDNVTSWVGWSADDTSAPCTWTGDLAGQHAHVRMLHLVVNKAR